MEGEAEEAPAGATASRLLRALLVVFLLVPLGLFVLAVVGVDLFLFGSEVVKLVSW